AIYFKGDWMHAFDPKRTEEHAFHLKDGTTKQVPMMMINEELAYMENDHFQAVTLPYGNGEMSMKVFLPKEDSDLDELKEQLSGKNWEKWNDSLTKQEGTLTLPKFQVEYEVTLNQTLEDLGMPTAFDKNNAEFTNKNEEGVRLWISKVKQK